MINLTKEIKINLKKKKRILLRPKILMLKTVRKKHKKSVLSLKAMNLQREISIKKKGLENLP